jgi:hypothetical protein
VQDPRCIPALGEQINMSLLLASNGVSMQPQFHGLVPSSALAAQEQMYRASLVPLRPGDELEAPLPHPTEMFRAVTSNTRVVALPQRNGILFFDNYTKRMLEAKVRVFARHGDTESTNGRARFAYWIHPSATHREKAVTLMVPPRWK